MVSRPASFFPPESSQREIHQLPTQLPHHREYTQREEGFVCEGDGNGSAAFGSFQSEREKGKMLGKTFGFKVEKKGVVVVVAVVVVGLVNSNRIPKWSCSSEQPLAFSIVTLHKSEPSKNVGGEKKSLSARAGGV